VPAESNAAREAEISRAIVVLRGQRVILDRELAVLYGLTTASSMRPSDVTLADFRKTSCFVLQPKNTPL